MNRLYIVPIILAFFLGGCAKENPFSPNEEEVTGQFLKSALAMDMNLDETVKKNLPTRSDVNIDDFMVIFSRPESGVPVKKFKYGEMPGVVTLPAGDYVCVATYGEDRIAEWENPYYTGRSGEFTINPYEITSYLDPIVCQLGNIKVTIDLDPMLRQKMSSDSHVEVKVGDNSSLKYTVEHADNSTAGYFKHTTETTLVATFNGKIDGVTAVETKSLKNISKGNHYKITFKLHQHEGDGSGDNDAIVKVDASVVVTDIYRNIEIGEDPMLDDDERPGEGDNPGDDPKDKTPEIKGIAPIDIDKLNTVDGTQPVEMVVTSFAEGGFVNFDVEIISNALTPEELEGVGLSAYLNLAETPEQFAAPLTNFGFPVNIKGQKVANIRIDTSLLGMLAAVGAGQEHQFKLTVTDANGTTIKSLKLFIP